MDVMLSTSFFRHIVPKEYQGSYGQMRRWLLEKGIIGKDATPMGVGYRIPTQGLSSTFSFKVVDVLPDRIGDTIIVPDEFTAMTGSDFDVDKLYLAITTLILFWYNVSKEVSTKHDIHTTVFIQET